MARSGQDRPDLQGLHGGQAGAEGPVHLRPEGPAEHPARAHRRRRLRPDRHVRRGVPTPTWTASPTTAAVHPVPHHGLCSPTRAALLTGRNHHSVGTGVISEAGTGFPGYTGIIPARRRRSPRSSASTATPTPGSARTTTSPTGRPASSGRSTVGPTAWGSTTSTASSAATPTSIHPRCREQQADRAA